MTEEHPDYYWAPLHGVSAAIARHGGTWRPVLIAATFYDDATARRIIDERVKSRVSLVEWISRLATALARTPPLWRARTPR